VEANSSAHILDDNHRKEAYAKLCNILPKWQTYRNGDNSEPLKTLERALINIAEEYNQLRNYTLLEFDKIPIELLAKVWHELGRVKEKNGSRNKNGYYSAIAVTKPLLLMWGQTPAFDSRVRSHMAQSYSIPKYSCNWRLDDWTRATNQLSETLKTSVKLAEFMKEETIRRYGEKTTVPYGRYIDVYYWKGP